VSTAGVARALRAHVETWRPYTLWYVGMVGLAGAALTDGPHHPWLLASAWAAPTAGWLGGHYLGDYFDRDLDAGSKPHRPIPSGRLRPGTALWCGSACFAVLALLAVLGGWGTTTAALLAACGIVAYSSWGKARGIAGNLVRGALGAIALLYGALTVGLPADTPSIVPVLLVSMVAFWSHDTMSNLVGALRDIDGDRAGGYLTLPVRRGTAFAVRTVLALYAVTVAAALTAGLLAGPSGRTGYLATLLVVVALGGTALAPLVTHRADMPVLVALRAHAVLVVERVVLASALVGLGLGIGPQLALTLPMVGLTWWSQRLMRTRHELGPGRSTRTLTTPRRAALEDVS
jgi:4-hydroxybenzoate polyprenyltransferase/geranylgeranylglycerol-phosphate geranylgeranyltransferase